MILQTGIIQKYLNYSKQILFVLKYFSVKDFQFALYEALSSNKMCFIEISTDKMDIPELAKGIYKKVHNYHKEKVS